MPDLSRTLVGSPQRDSAAARSMDRMGGSDESWHQQYLAGLGERVRNLRARRGMSRKSLAQNSAVSERYLAQLEAGRGNISISLLRQIARATNVPIEDLVRDGPEPSVELTLLQEHLRGLDEPALATLYAQITGRFPGAPEVTGRFAFIGLRGAGKTTLGAALARRLNVPFIELVQEIEREAGASVTEILSSQGQAAYRRLERQSLDRTLERFEHVVLATGGSLVSEPSTYERLLTCCSTIWLKADPDEHMQRVIAQGDYRPMAGNVAAMDDLNRILKERSSLYQRAHHIINTSGQTVPQSLAALLDLDAVQQQLPKGEET